MIRREVTAPAYHQLRLNTGLPPPQPVYEHLEDALATAMGQPGPDGMGVVPYVLATCSAYAYSDEETLAMIVSRLGLEKNRCLRIGQDVDAMFIHTTAYVLQSESGRVAILCYRGTEPTNLVNWLLDADVSPEKIDFPGRSFDVHAGFYRNTRATELQVMAALELARQGKSIFGDGATVSPLEALYVTGHSFGGAMAAMMATLMAMDERYIEIARLLRAVYTYGQPMIGDRITDEPGSPLSEKLFRYVYRKDVVAELPPRATGPFEHFGQEWRYTTVAAKDKWVRSENPTSQLEDLSGLMVAVGAFAAQMFAVGRAWNKILPFPHSLYDHEPQHYICALTPEGVHSEFGRG